MKRLDTAPKLDGSLVYAIDLKLPGMLSAAIKDCPVFGGKLVSFDNAKIASMPGVKRAVKVNDTTVAVVADTWWHAKTALDALPIVWDEGAERDAGRARQIAEHLKEGPDGEGSLCDAQRRRRAEGDRRGAAKKVEAVYRTPFLAHATMEPMNCTVRISADKAEAWVPTQNGEASLAALAEATGLPLDKCEVYKHVLGGGFGRRGGTQDYVRQAVAIAKQFPGVPVKMIWSREEDMTHDFFRPISQCALRRGHRRRRQSRRAARARVGPVDQRVQQLGARRRTARTTGSCRATTRSPATRSWATRCPTCCSNTRCATRTCRSARGAASTPTRTPSTWNASSTRWRRRPARIRSNSAAR